MNAFTASIINKYNKEDYKDIVAGIKNKLQKKKDKKIIKTK